MAAKAVSLVVVTILLSAVIVGAIGTHDAEAKSTAKKSPSHKFSKWIKSVCGDELCPGTPYSKITQKIGKSSPNR
jgi:hypothetical protein